FTIFEVQQTPAFINDVQFLEGTRRAVHPVLDVNPVFYACHLAVLGVLAL
ncbi:TPA: hypothetical protein N6I64_005153, partial [Escherichia coli]|nr:hypothetical protein [Escherichia coli]